MEIRAQLAQATTVGGRGVFNPGYWVRADFKEYESFHGKINGYENDQFQQYTF